LAAGSPRCSYGLVLMKAAARTYKQEVGGSSPPTPTDKSWSEPLSVHQWSEIGRFPRDHPRNVLRPRRAMFVIVAKVHEGGDSYGAFDLPRRQEVVGSIHALPQPALPRPQRLSRATPQSSRDSGYAAAILDGHHR
jgi:hypothetical protein